MKRNLFLVLVHILTVLTISSCKKDKAQVCSSSSFDGITRNCIVEAESSMQSLAIPAVDASGMTVLQQGTIVIYKTTNGKYGKMAVSVDGPSGNKLILKGVTYNDDGSVYKNTGSLIIDVNDFADLDEMVQSSAQNIIDIFWSQINLKIDLVPMVGAKFVKYNF